MTGETRQFRALFESALDAILIADDDGRYVDANPAACDLFGVPHGKLIGKRVSDFVVENRVTANEQTWKEFRDSKAMSGEFLLKRPNGEQRILEYRATADYLPGLHMSILRDITERRRWEQMFRRMLNTNVTGMAFSRITGEFIDVNDKFLELLGYTREELRAGEISWSKVVPESYGDINRTARDELLAHGVARPFESQYIRKDGTLVPLLVSVTLVDPERGETFAFFLDLRERMEMETKLRRSDRLAAIGKLAAGVAHEINNPLSYVLTNLDLLKEEFGLPAAALKLVAGISEGVVRVRDIVGDLKSFSRSDDTPQEAVDVVEALNASVAIAFNEVTHKAKLRRRFSGVPRVWGNRSKLGQVFLNLLINAAQAISEGNVEGNCITVEIGTSSTGEVVITIADTGKGMNDEVLKHIFDPFFTTKAPGEGTGLGLSVCHGIVTSMGGHISVKSTPGLGSEFTVTLPAAAATARAGANDEPRREMVANRRARILVIDDERMLAESLQRGLAGAHDTDILFSAADAIAKIRAGANYDVIVCDVMMPEVSGIDFHEQLRKFDAGLSERVIFMTGGAFTAKTNAFLSEIPNKILAKPFGVKILRETISEFLRERKT